MSYRATHPEDGMVYCCPNCSTAGPTDRQAPGYRCTECGLEFDTPVEREARHAGGADPYDDDGLPHGIADDVKAQILAARGEADG